MFSQNLKYLRQKNGMGQLDLAHMLGRKTISTISEWESGKYTPKLIVLSKIAKIFNVSIDDLMDNDLANNPEKYPSKDKKDYLIMKKIHKLNEESRKSANDYIDYLLSNQEK